MEIKNVTVIGGGRMGRQIGLCAAIHGYNTVVFDLIPAVREDVVAWSKEYLAGRVAKKRMTEAQVADIAAHFRVEAELKEAVEDSDLVIEAIYEDKTAKCEILGKISEIVRPTTIIATNSSFMVSSLFADSVKDPSRLCNMHFYNPALVMAFVEVVQGPHCSEETGKAAYDFCISLGKKPVLQKKELPGFAGNYLIRFINNTAQYMAATDIMSIPDIDTLMEKGFGRKKGPFHLMDMTGVNLTQKIQADAYARTGVKPYLFDLVTALTERGAIGLQAGHGFYDYEAPFDQNESYIPKWDGLTLKDIKSIGILGAQPEVLALGEKAKAEGLTVKVAEDVALLSGMDLILEALPEDAAAKKAALAKLAAVAPEAILASCTDDIAPSVLGAGLKAADKLVSLHFFAGAEPVELVQGAASKETVGALYLLLQKLGKAPLWEKQELPGFGFGYMLAAIGESACYLVEDGFCTAEETDICLIHGLGFTYGFFQTVDMLGVDKFFATLEAKYKETGKKPYMYDVFAQKVAAGELGVKAGKGFYQY